MDKRKTILITGASSGLGAALARKLARDDVNLILNGRDKERLDTLSHDCQIKGAEVRCVVSDINEVSKCELLIKETITQFSSLDMVIFSAGLGMDALFEEITDITFFDSMMKINYLSQVYLSHYALPYLKQSKGMIVSISSLQGLVGMPRRTSYAATKHALDGFFKSLSLELVDKVHILMVYPGWIKNTRLRARALDETGEAMGDSAKPHSKLAIDLEHCTQKIDMAIRKKKTKLYVPWYYQLLPLISQLSAHCYRLLISKTR